MRSPRLLSLATCALLAAGLRPVLAEQPWQETYTDQAEVETIYGSESEAISLDAARELLLELINTARRDAGLPGLALSAPAQQLAQVHADDMAQQHYVAHRDLAGAKCELRFNRQGETDQVSENIAYYEIQAAIFLTPRLVRRMHEHWLGSAGHRENLLQPALTHAGCGFGVLRLPVPEGGTVSYIAGVEEFVSDYGHTDLLPVAARPGETLHLSGTLDPLRAELLYVGLASEPLPAAHTVAELMSDIHGYSPPDVVLAYQPVETFGDGATGQPVLPETIRYRQRLVRYDQTSGDYSVDLALAEHWPKAAYYVTVWARSRDPQLGDFCASTQVVLVQRDARQG